MPIGTLESADTTPVRDPATGNFLPSTGCSWNDVANPLTTSCNGGNWRFTANALADGGNVIEAKFLILHLQARSGPTSNPVRSLAPGDQLTVQLNNGTQQVFTSADGGNFWTLPIATKTTDIRLTGNGGSRIRLLEYGHGHGADIFSGATDFPLGDVNGNGFWPEDATDKPAWEPTNVSTLTPAQTKGVASVGFVVFLRKALDDAGAEVTQIGTGSAVLFHDVAADKNRLLTAMHVVNTGPSDAPPGEDPESAFPLEVVTGSVTFNYQPGGGAPRYYKLRSLVKNGFQFGIGNEDAGGIDYAVVEFDQPLGFAVPAVEIADTAAADGDELFIIHHPGSRAKKISRNRDQASTTTTPRFFEESKNRIVTGGTIPTDATSTSIIRSNLFYDSDIDNGSSGSPVFNPQTKIMGIVTNVVPMNLANPTRTNPLYAAFGHYNRGPKIGAIAFDFQRTQRTKAVLRVVVVVDTSGSMSLLGTTDFKIEEAKRAVALFFSLLRAEANTSATQHSAAMISFGSDVKPTPIQVMVPFNSGIQGNMPALIGQLTTSGTTAIGKAIERAQLELNAAPSNKTSTIILLTDGKQNVHPLIDLEPIAVDSDTRINIIGFGQTQDLDGDLLTRYAREHKGIYFRAERDLDLKKLFAFYYGHIFEFGTSYDPPSVIPAGSDTADPISFNVSGEQTVRVVLGWERADADLTMTVISPTQERLTVASPNVDGKVGDTWSHMTLNLPYNSASDGTWQVEVKRLKQRPLRFRGHGANVLSAAFSADGKNFLSGAQNDSILLWDVKSDHPIRQFWFGESHTEAPGIIDIAFVNGGNTMLTASMQDGLIEWDIRTAQQIHRYTEGETKSTGWAMVYNPQRNIAAVAAVVGGLQIWNISTKKLIAIFQDYSAGKLAFSSDGQHLAAIVATNGDGGEQRKLVLINVDSGQAEVATFNESFPASCVACSPDGKTILVGTDEGTISLFDAQTGENLFTSDNDNSSHFRRVSSITYSPDGRLALSSATGGSDGDLSLAIILWDLENKILLRSFEGHDGGVNAIAFSPDGTKAISASEDTTLLLWNVPDGTPALGPLDFEEHFFVSTIVTSNIYMTPVTADTPAYYYTGDPIYPQVALRYVDGLRRIAKVTLEIEAPTQTVGNILSANKLDDAQSINGDALNSIDATLVNLANQQTEPLIPHTILPQRYDLFDDGKHFDGAMESDGIYGNEIPDITRFEGEYTLHARASWGTGIQATRETVWSIHVSVAIDPDKTNIKISPPTPPDDKTYTIQITPKDSYGNNLGPGRGDKFQPIPLPGTELSGPIRDLGNGSYEQKVVWNDKTLTPHLGISITQPWRAPVLIVPKPLDNKETDEGKGILLFLALILASLIPLINSDNATGKSALYKRLLLLLIILVIVFVIAYVLGYQAIR